MADRALQGVGVLVTRPRTQAIELVDAIEARGGDAYCFPVIEIAPREDLEVLLDQLYELIFRPDARVLVLGKFVFNGHTYLLRLTHRTRIGDLDELVRTLGQQRQRYS